MERWKMSIPKIIHQVWLGPRPPLPYMKEWEKFCSENEGWKYMLWTESNIGILPRLADHYKASPVWCGKSDIVRLEKLYEYGGIYLDSDSIFVKKFPESLLENRSFVGASSDGLINNGVIGCTRKHPLVDRFIDFISQKSMDDILNIPAYKITGPVAFADIVRTEPDVRVYPTHFFYPFHHDMKASFDKSTDLNDIVTMQAWDSTLRSNPEMRSRMDAILLQLKARIDSL